jgi:MFS transporter, DHA3 family, macrolide efflux protein
MMMVAVSFLDVMYTSIRQVKVPPDMQGRFIGAFTQVRMLVMPIAYLMVGPLVDQVFEPAVETSGWDNIAPLVGDDAGAGMGLLFMICGALLIVCTLIAITIPNIRNLEAVLPDYDPVIEEK